MQLIQPSTGTKPVRIPCCSRLRERGPAMHDDFHLPQHPRAVTCAALDMPPGTFDTWKREGYLQNFDAKPIGRANALLCSTADVLALSLVREASTWGLIPTELPGLATLVADHW